MMEVEQEAKVISGERNSDKSADVNPGMEEDGIRNLAGRGGENPGGDEDEEKGACGAGQGSEKDEQEKTSKVKGWMGSINLDLGTVLMMFK
jgi:hypothetical protein